jgi:hypothetical protein
MNISLHAGFVAMLLTCFGEVFVSNLGLIQAIQRFSWFSQSLQSHARIVTPLDHDHFVSNPLQFISHPTTSRYIVKTLSVTK